MPEEPDGLTGDQIAKKFDNAHRVAKRASQGFAFLAFVIVVLVGKTAIKDGFALTWRNAILVIAAFALGLVARFQWRRSAELTVWGDD